MLLQFTCCLTGLRMQIYLHPSGSGLSTEIVVLKGNRKVPEASLELYRNDIPDMYMSQPVIQKCSQGINLHSQCKNPYRTWRYGCPFWAHLCFCMVGSDASLSVCLSLDQNPRLENNSYLAKFNLTLNRAHLPVTWLIDFSLELQL